MDIEGWKLLSIILFTIAVLCFTFFVHISLEVHRLRRRLTELRSDLRDATMEAHKLRLDALMARSRKQPTDELTQDEIDYLHKSLGITP